MSAATESDERSVNKSLLWKLLAILLLGEKTVNPPQQEVIDPVHKSVKRIVSRSEYVGILCRKAALLLSGVGAGLIATTCAVGAVLVLKYVLGDNRLPGQWVGVGLLSGSAACFLFIFAGKWLGQAAEDVDAVLLTSEVAQSLAAPDSLVRASQEPAQAQEAMLLRAATQTPEKCEEQLLRAVAGGHEK